MRLRALIVPIAAAALLSTSAACERDEPAEPAPTVPAAPTEPAAPAEPAAEAPAAEAAPAAADEAPASPCAQGYADRVELEAQLAEQLGEDGDAVEPLDREAFMTLCEGLSEEMQKCMTFEYAMRNQKACEAAEAGMDEATRAKFDALKSE